MYSTMVTHQFFAHIKSKQGPYDREVEVGLRIWLVRLLPHMWLRAFLAQPLIHTYFQTVLTYPSGLILQSRSDRVTPIGYTKAA